MLSQWLLRFRDKIVTTCPKLNIKNIINDDGTLHEYAQFVDPHYLIDPDDKIQVNKYTIRFNMALRKRDDYRSDRLAVASIIHSHVGTESGAKVIEKTQSFASGDTKDFDDPLEYLRFVLTIHYKNARANSTIV